MIQEASSAWSQKKGLITAVYNDILIKSQDS